MGGPKTKLPEAADLVIIGGGVMGLSTAYNIARLSKLRVVVIEKSYLVSGASGRNGGGVRVQFGDAGNVELMVEGIEICKGLAQELGINLWFRQSGYLFLARTARGEAQLHRNVALHREYNAPTRLLGPHEAADIVPELDVSTVRLAAYNPEDAVVFPWPFAWGYAAKAVELGVTVRTHTAVERLEPRASGFRVHLSTSEHIDAQRVINATGAWSIELNRDLGVELPNHPHRHEILATEPIKPFLDPLVADLASSLYFSQSSRGEIVTGISMPDEERAEADDEVCLDSSLAFLSYVSRALCELLPVARSLKVLRQWAGPYDVSPDGDAIVGETPGHPDLVQLCGFTGHGFMMAPAVGKLLARWLVLGEKHPMLTRWDPGRFRDGHTARREDMIIG